MSFGGINGGGPQGAPVFGNQGPAATPAAAGAVPGQAGAPANGATPFFGASFESIYAAACRGEVPLNLTVSANGLGGVSSSPNSNISLLQAMSQGVPQNGTNGLGVKAGPQPGEGTAALGINGTAFGGTQIVDAKQMSNVPGVGNQYTGN
jgi:hypothetical protein